MGSKKYTFEEVTRCEMCGDPAEGHKILGLRLNVSQGRRPGNKSGIAVGVKRCSRCDLVYASPMPIPNDVQDHYGIPPENYWQPSYFNWDPGYFSHEIERLKQLIQVKPGMKALDIGAGLGKCMISLEKAGFDAYGIEPSKPFYERAISQMNISPQKLKMEMLEDVEFEEASFDFITFGAVFEHVYHPASCLEKALKWLKPNGVIHMEVPSSNYLISKVINFYYRMVGTNYVTNISPMHEPFHLHEFGLRSFEQLGKRLDFKIDFFEYFVCDVFFLPKILHRPLQWIMKRSNSGMQLSIYLRKNSANPA
jgi:2-polyprenyl-3-methyl-5-hydroxy-6-metoxy-1,4-benzoquinol methylase